jgi:hypothetical protein
VLLGELQRLRPVRRRHHVEAGEAQARRQQLADVRLIVHDQQLRFKSLVCHE